MQGVEILTLSCMGSRVV